MLYKGLSRVKGVNSPIILIEIVTPIFIHNTTKPYLNCLHNKQHYLDYQKP
jgi:hypothetical protein